MTEYPELESYRTLAIPLSVIYFDTEFNCRGSFTPQSCFELAESMESKGLKIPIMLQPREDIPNLETGFEFRIIAGHRRYTAAKYFLRWSSIPAIIVNGLTEEDAYVLNLVENLERKDLTFYQEAVALRKSYSAGTSFEKMGRDLSKSSSWCRFRWKLLDLPERIIKLVETGAIKQQVLTTIIYQTQEEQLALAAEIKTAEVHGAELIECAPRAPRQVARSRKTIDRMLTELMVDGRYPSPYHALTWAAGRITDEEFLGDVKLIQDGGKDARNVVKKTGGVT